MKKLLVTCFAIFISLSFICPTVSSASENQFEKLKGRWFRLDGGYTLEIKNIEPNGKMEAAYFNPRPIYVSQAKAKEEKGNVEVFIKLQDRGYPGSTYTLTYNPKRDELQGVYFQAALQQDFKVVFIKVK